MLNHKHTNTRFHGYGKYKIGKRIFAKQYMQCNAMHCMSKLQKSITLLLCPELSLVVNYKNVHKYIFGLSLVSEWKVGPSFSNKLQSKLLSFFIFFNEKKIRRIWSSFDIEKWLLRSELFCFLPLILRPKGQ